MGTQTQTDHPSHPLLAAIIDVAMWPFRNVRRSLIPTASGRVLEIGVGTGPNLPLYRGASAVDALFGIEPDPHMLRRAQRRVERARLPFPVELRAASAEALPFDDHSFDTVVGTWVLCTIPDPQRALAEVSRVLRPGGRLVWAEHVQSSVPAAARIQRAVDPLWQHLAGGCHLTRDARTLIRAAGLREVECRPVGGQRFTLLPTLRGVSTRP